MASATITISDNTKAIQSLAALLLQGSQPGYAVLPTNGLGSLPQGGGIGNQGITNVVFLSIQASKTNTTLIVYVGDEATKADGSRQGRELAAGDVMQFQADQFSAVSLADIFVTGANTTKVNIFWKYA